jgi:hypothetical protein
MNSWVKTSIVLTVLACGRQPRPSEHARVDTTLTFIALPPPSAADSAKAPSTDSVLATIRAYREERIAADVAASIIVDYLLVGGTVEYSKAGGSIRPEREKALADGVDREIQRRVSRAGKK